MQAEHLPRQADRLTHFVAADSEIPNLEFPAAPRVEQVFEPRRPGLVVPHVRAENRGPAQTKNAINAGRFGRAPFGPAGALRIHVHAMPAEAAVRVDVRIRFETIEQRRVGVGQMAFAVLIPAGEVLLQNSPIDVCRAHHQFAKHAAGQQRQEHGGEFEGGSFSPGLDAHHRNRAGKITIGMPTHCRRA